MALSLYDTTVPLFISGLNTLSHILTKAEAFAKEKGISESDFLASNLIADMRPIPFQIQTAANTSVKTVARLNGTTPVPVEDNETTFAQLQARIAKTLELLKGAEKASFEGDVHTEIEVPMGKATRKFTRLGYVQTFALPNFYFHVTTAYAILRAKGVDVGKGDFLTPSEK